MMAHNDQEHHTSSDEENSGEASSDPGDAFEWLERLAADQGAPTEELPTLQGKEQAPIPPAEHIPDWLRELAPRTEPDQTQPPTPLAEELADLAEDIPSPVDELPDWLQPVDDTQTAEPSFPEPPLMPETVERPGTVSPAEVAPAADLPTLPADAMVQDESTEPEAESVAAVTGTDQAPEEDDDAALAWLEQLATSQSAPVEQPPLAEAAGEAFPPSQPIAELDEMAPADDVTRPAFPVPEPAVIANLEELGELPEDVDEAMAWLEALASRQAASAEEVTPPPVPAQPDVGALEAELPIPADRAATPIADELIPPPPEEPEPASAIDQPELPEWLRDLSAEARVSKEEETEPMPPEPAPVAEEPELPEWLRAEAPVPAAAEEPEPPERLTEETGEPAAVVEEPGLPEWLRAEAPVPAAAEEPEPLERLTEETGEPAAVVEEPGLPEWLRAEAPVPAAAEVPEPPPPAVEEGPLPPVAELPVEETEFAEAPPQPVAPMVEMAEPLVEEQEVPWVVEAAPEPAAPQIKEGPPEPVAELPIEETEVPEAVPQPVAPMVEVAEPLVEEQEVPQAVEAAPEPAAPRVEEEPPPVAEPDAVPGDEPAVPELTQVVTGMAEFRAQLAAEPGDHVTRLALARALLDDDALNHALLEYGALVAAGQELDDVVEDLELIVPSNPANTLALRTLGDAHMKQGELGKALKAYRQALAHL
ncbi:MAG: hypothetical protein GQ526_01475 [Ardenticatenales bacterium]|nr:hypothetical protein [Ardenticatenales bacterium]